jgi:tetraacyldisaccharide 4'-kinase
MSAPHSRGAEALQSAWLRRGPLACALWPLSLLYKGLWALHRRLGRGDVAQADTARLELPPVVVVGNLIAGGAGKTPTVLALAALLKRHGHAPGVVSRGYGRDGDDVLAVSADATAEQVGDEPLLLHLRAQVPVVVGRDRLAAARALVRRHPEVDVLLSDDGLQHRRLPRDAQVIVFDERGIGNGWLLPAGPLREPFAPSRVPQRSLVVYNAPAASTPWPGHLATRRLGGLVALADWWRGEAPQADAFVRARDREWIAAAGVARPGRFFDMLRAQGLRITEMPLPDHHDFTALPWPAGTPAVVVTEKDAVKLRPGQPGTETVWVATLDFALPPEFEAALMRLLPKRAPLVPVAR